MHPDIKEVLYDEEQIKQRVAEIGAAITSEYAERAAAGEKIVLVSVLRGAAIFMADLARAIKLPLEMDYMAVSSYGAGTKSSGVVRILKDLSSSVEGKHVIIAEEGQAAGRHPLPVRGLRMPQRVHRGLRAGFRRALPQPALYRHPEA